MFMLAQKMQNWYQRKFLKFGSDILYRLGVIVKVHQGRVTPIPANGGLNQSGRIFLTE